LKRKGEIEPIGTLDYHDDGCSIVVLPKGLAGKYLTISRITHIFSGHTPNEVKTVLGFLPELTS